MNRIVVTCLLFGMLVESAIAQSTESVKSNTQIDLSNRVGPEEKPDSFVVYQNGCRSGSVKVGSYGKVSEALAAAEKRAEPYAPAVWIYTGNLEHATSFSNRTRTKQCYIYSKSLRCGNWTLQMKTLTAQEAEAHVAKWKETSSNPLAIIYELE